VKKQQLIVVGSGFALLMLLFFFGNTIPPKKPSTAPVPQSSDAAKPVEIKQLLTHAKERLTPQQLERVNKIENSISRGDVKNQQMPTIPPKLLSWKILKKASPLQPICF
jgi:hypothetical protein